jgi:anti-sigma factor RsiW
MSCDEFQGLLQDYVTRHLAPEKRKAVDTHLLECPGCQRELAVLTALVSSLDHQPVLEPSHEFSARVLSNLPRQRAFYPGPWWALVLIPILGFAAWLFRGPLLAGSFELARRLNVGPETLGQLRLPVPSSVTAGQLAMVPLVVVGLSVALAVVAATYGRKLVEDY